MLRYVARNIQSEVTLFGLLHKSPRKRKYKIARGDAAEIARKLKLNPGHVSKVANGKREGSSSLTEELQNAEQAQAERSRLKPMDRVPG